MDHIWVTEGGDELRIQDMSVYHIRNCIKFLRRRQIEEGCNCNAVDEDTGKSLFKWKLLFATELRKRGQAKA